MLCSGDTLLEPLVACAGATLQAVATSLDIPVRAGRVRAEGDVDFAGRSAWTARRRRLYSTRAEASTGDCHRCQHWPITGPMLFFRVVWQGSPPHEFRAGLRPIPSASEASWCPWARRPRGLR